MLTGISTACLYPMETERALEVMLGLGFDCFEVFANCESELTDKYIETLGKMMAARGARVYSLHLFTGSYEPFMFFSNYKRRFDDSIKQFRRYFRSARLLGASVVVFHGGHRNALMEIEEYCERFLLPAAGSPSPARGR
ncbi:MAG TPA: TIM barrel protein [Clostridia bacterium]|nr:TIM barrel protein [Clostridia bacterium]